MKVHLVRRAVLRHLGIGVIASGALLAACERKADLTSGGANDPEAALDYRYQGISGGGALYIDADYKTNGRSVIYDANDVVFARGQFGPGNYQRFGYFGDEANGGLPVPRMLRMLRYSEDAERNPEWYREQRLYVQPEFLGPPAVDVTVPVASRIPDEVLNRIRKYGGGLKLKLRLTPETILVGWEVINGPNYPYVTDAVGDRLITDVDRMIGGDFCEAQTFTRKINGVWQTIHRKGWQINPKTGQKIATDF